MTANLSNKALNKLYESGSRKFINIDHRIGLPDLVEDIKLNKKYQFTRSQNSEWNTERKSHLIESLLVNVPIIPIVLYESNYGEYDVIDGNQRIRAIVDFYKNKFELTGVKFLPELNGYNIKDYPPR